MSRTVRPTAHLNVRNVVSLHLDTRSVLPNHHPTNTDALVIPPTLARLRGCGGGTADSRAAVVTGSGIVKVSCGCGGALLPVRR
jgi:hypothetical protein